jgi:hypothetical protein
MSDSCDSSIRPFTIDVPEEVLEDLVPPVRHWVEGAFTDIRHWSEHSNGGHFAAFEVPEVFTDELRTFFRLFR